MGLCSPTLKDELNRELLECNYHAFLRTIANVLKGMWFEDVQLMGRTDFVGRNGSDGKGGVDILAYREVPGGRRLVAIQAKQFTQPIYQRSIDELCGAVIRLGAAEGMLITTGSFSPSIDVTALASAPVAPVRLMSGAELADKMVLSRTGVKRVPSYDNPASGPYILDRRYFESVNAEYTGVARASGDEARAVYIVVGGKARKRQEVL